MPLLILLSAAGAARANPGGAPWGHAGAPAAEAANRLIGAPAGADCTACHFDAPPLRNVPALGVNGLPTLVTPEGRYQLMVVLRAPMVRAGFQLRVSDEKGKVLGVLHAGDGRVEVGPEGARSTLAGATPLGLNVTHWSVEWIAPKTVQGPIVFSVAANAGNDDASPFGDKIYLYQTRVLPAPVPRGDGKAH
ncbi:MAG: choice-of-anchor V domain-containing protein [Pseudomonadota bacterium]